MIVWTIMMYLLMPDGSHHDFQDMVQAPNAEQCLDMATLKLEEKHRQFPEAVTGIKFCIKK